MNMGKRPVNAFEAETVRDPWIPINVLVVIIVDEVVPDCLTKYAQNDYHQKDGNDQGMKVGRRGLSDANFSHLLWSNPFGHRKDYSTEPNSGKRRTILY